MGGLSTASEGTSDVSMLCRLALADSLGRRAGRFTVTDGDVPGTAAVAELGGTDAWAVEMRYVGAWDPGLRDGDSANAARSLPGA